LSLLFLINSETNQHIDDLQNDIADDTGINNGRNHTDGLCTHLGSNGFISVSKTRSTKLRSTQDTNAECANDPANRMDTKYIKAIVVFKRAFQRRRRKETTDTSNQAKNNRSHGTNRATSWGNSNKQQAHFLH